MDLTFSTDEGRFNYRVSAVILRENRLLVMRDENAPYFYLPGGRVKLFETAEAAVLRELKEELRIEAEIGRTLWLNECFFTEDVTRENYHELCVYFLMDVSKTDLYARGDRFVLRERRHTLEFEWLDFDRLQTAYLYPLFIKEKIFNLPEHPELLTAPEWDR